MESSRTTASDLSRHTSTTHFPLPFRNPGLLDTNGNVKKILRNKLVNRLNHLNFVNGAVSVVFRHEQPCDDVYLSALPLPCRNEDFTCQLALDDTVGRFNDYFPSCLLIDDGLEAMIIPITSYRLCQNNLDIQLPDEGLVTTKRSVRRRRCDNVDCEILSPGHSFRTAMIDFTPGAFSLQRSFSDSGATTGYPEEATINILSQNTPVFSGLCRLIRSGSADNRAVYAPMADHLPLFPQRQTRNPRRQITPSFAIRFRHPLFAENVERDIFDVSTSGFSVRENLSEQTLLAGLHLPNLVISYAGVIEMTCSAQVVYHREDAENHVMQYGLAITDMDVLSYSRLNHLVGAHLDNGARVSTTVNMDALWEFFFDTGFIYGEKYRHIYPHREAFVETYRKLYRDNPDIARHFTYEKNGKIYGHISMVHAYQPSWVIHHFSARPLESKIPGFLILRQIAHYLNGCYRFQSSRIDYVMTYYRPDNKVVSRIFGGFARELDNPRGSSLDLFSYLYVGLAGCPRDLPAGWTLQKCTQNDFDILKTAYEKRSGGLLWEAFGLNLSVLSLQKAFGKSGFQRNYETYCLMSGRGPQAFFIVNRSDMCLNLSDLINSIKIIITDDHHLDWQTVLSAVGKLGTCYAEDQIPLLVYPSDYLNSQGISNDKNYELWILKTNPYLEQYTDYMARRFRTKYRDE